jgi:hypothetical protein
MDSVTMERWERNWLVKMTQLFQYVPIEKAQTYGDPCPKCGATFACVAEMLHHIKFAISNPDGATCVVAPMERRAPISGQWCYVLDKNDVGILMEAPLPKLPLNLIRGNHVPYCQFYGLHSSKELKNEWHYEMELKAKRLKAKSLSRSADTDNDLWSIFTVPEVD